MNAAWKRIDGFFFRPVSARGFGLLRIGWSLTALSYLLMQWRDVIAFYSNDGLLPTDLNALILRGAYRFSLLDWVTDPAWIFALYLLLCLALFLAMLGLRTRASVAVSFILLCSFHERNLLILGGGDTVLRLVGFLLLIAPGITALSLDRLLAQWKHWKKTRTLLPELMQPIWPYRLLLWQFIVIYVMSVWVKLTGTMWREGIAAGAALRHPFFSRIPSHERLIDLIATPVTWFTLIFESAWILLLLPAPFTRRIKQALIVFSMFFHGGIQATMIVGSFSIAMITGYAGLLLGNDFEELRSTINGKWHSKQWKIIVLYDGRCGLCLRSIFTLTLLDWLGRLRFVDFWDKEQKVAVAPDLKLEDLNKAMHVRFQQINNPQLAMNNLTGFDGIRALSWHLPPLWPLVPFLYLPGIAQLGRFVYAGVARRRKRCDHEHCGL